MNRSTSAQVLHLALYASENWHREIGAALVGDDGAPLDVLQDTIEMAGPATQVVISQLCADAFIGTAGGGRFEVYRDPWSFWVIVYDREVQAVLQQRNQPPRWSLDPGCQDFVHDLDGGSYRFDQQAA